MKFIARIGAAACCVCLLAGQASAQLEWFEEHGDIGIAYEGGELELHYHFEDGLNGVGPEVEYEPDEVYIRVADATMDTAPVGGIPFLGLLAGEDFWSLPQSGSVADTLGVPFVGIATEELTNPPISSVDLTLTGMTGPGGGEFALWQAGITPTVFMQTQDGISGADTLTMGVGLHDHFNYGFTEAGVYDVEFTATATLTAGGTATDTGTFTFVVGDTTAVPEPGSLAALASLGLFGVMSRRRRRRNA